MDGGWNDMIYIFGYIILTLGWQMSVCRRLRRSVLYRAAGRRMRIVSYVAVACMLIYVVLPLTQMDKTAVGIACFWAVMVGAFCLMWAALITANIFTQALYGKNWLDYRNQNLAAVMILPWGLYEIEKQMKDAKEGCLSIAAKVEMMFRDQAAKWPLAAQNYAALSEVQLRPIDMGGFSVYVQYNPGRRISTTAKIDKESISARKCFLCEGNRPAEQMLIPWRDYDILVNPYPIFDPHLTIPCKNHERQQVTERIPDMLAIAEELPGWAVFYNGPKCGASAPDHFHFQAVRRERVPMIDDYERLPMTEINGLKRIDNYLREILCIEGRNADEIEERFRELLPLMHKETDEDWEPMMNIVCQYLGDHWRLFVIPRQKYRPWQYTAEGSENIMISPGTIEMCGVLIAPREEDYLRLTAEDVRSIYEQVSYNI